MKMIAVDDVGGRRCGRWVERKSGGMTGRKNEKKKNKTLSFGTRRNRGTWRNIYLVRQDFQRPSKYRTTKAGNVRPTLAATEERPTRLLKELILVAPNVSADRRVLSWC